LVAAAKFFVEATKNSFAVPNFVAVTKPFFPCGVFFFSLVKHYNQHNHRTFRLCICSSAVEFRFITIGIEIKNSSNVTYPFRGQVAATERYASASSDLPIVG